MGECRSSIAHRLCQTLHEGGTVEPIVILNRHRGVTIEIRDVESYLELRSIEFHNLLCQHLLATHTVVAQYTYLVGKHDVGLEVVVSGYASERIVLMAQGVLKLLSTLMDKLADALIANVDAQRQGVDEHTHGVHHLEIATTIGDGGDAHLIIGSKTREGIEHSSEHDGSRGDTELLGELLHLIPLYGGRDLAVVAWRMRRDEVGRYLGDALDA